MGSLLHLVARNVRRNVIRSNPQHLNSGGTNSCLPWESDEGLAEEEEFLDENVFASSPSADEAEDAFSDIQQALLARPRDACRANLGSSSSELACAEPSMPISTIPNIVQCREFTTPMIFDIVNLLQNNKSVKMAMFTVATSPEVWEVVNRTIAAANIWKNTDESDWDVGFVSLGKGSPALGTKPGIFIRIKDWLASNVSMILELVNQMFEGTKPTNLTELIDAAEKFQYEMKLSFFGAILVFLIVIMKRALKAMKRVLKAMKVEMHF